MWTRCGWIQITLLFCICRREWRRSYRTLRCRHDSKIRFKVPIRSSTLLLFLKFQRFISLVRYINPNPSRTHSLSSSIVRQVRKRFGPQRHLLLALRLLRRRLPRLQSRRAQPRHRRHSATRQDRGWNWDPDILWTSWHHRLVQIWDVDVFGAVVVAGWDDLDDFITWEFESGDVAGRACHEVAVKHAEDRLVRDDEKVVLFAFEFENDGFEADGQVMVRLCVCVSGSIIT